MLKFSIKYYLKCIFVSIFFYIFGGEILVFGIAEEEAINIALIIVPVFYIVGVLIRLKILKRQFKRQDYTINNKSIVQLSLPAIILFIITIMLCLFDFFINLYCQSNRIISSFDNFKTILLFLFPGGLNINSFIYVLSDWNDIIFYVMMLISTLVYIIPTLIYAKKTENRRNQGTVSVKT